MSQKIAQLERLLQDLEAGKLRPSESERLFFQDANGNKVRVNSPEAAAKLRERIEKERAS
jgi:hypothetical protein